MSEGDSVCADVRVGGTHIQLFSEHTAGGVKVSVFEVDTREWVARYEAADDIEQGQKKAEELTKAYLESTMGTELPTVIWRKSSGPSWLMLSSPNKVASKL